MVPDEMAVGTRGLCACFQTELARWTAAWAAGQRVQVRLLILLGYALENRCGGVNGRVVVE